MLNKILEVLAKHPNGLRLRTIGGLLGVWHVKLVPLMDELEAAGKVVALPHRDMGNAEFYYIWRIVN